MRKLPDSIRLLIAAGLATSPAVGLCEDGAAGAGAQARPYVLESVVVTANKREEDLQDVPVSAQSFRGDTLEAKGITDLRQLGEVVPGMQFTTLAGFPIVFIRGLGTDNFVPSADPSIATYIDGIYTPLGINGLSSLAGLRRVEVLKGPQGTMFGRDATGGAINMWTEDPGNRVRGMVEGELGMYADRTARLAFSAPITDNLSAGVYGIYQRQDTPFKNPNFDNAPNVLKAGRAKLLWHTDNLSLNLTAYHGDTSGTENLAGKNVHPSLLGSLTGIVAQGDDFDTATDHPGFNHSKQDIDYGTFTWYGPWFDLKLLGSYQRLETPYSSIDFDGSPLPVAALTTTNTFDHLQTGELQLLSNDQSWNADHLQWVFGVYYLHSLAGEDPGFLQILPSGVLGLLNTLKNPLLTDLGTDIQALADAIGLKNTPVGSGGLQLAFRGILGTRSLSAYSQATYRITDWVDLTLGGRAQHEDRFLTKSETDLGNLNGSGTTTLMKSTLPSATSDSFSPHAALSFHPFDNTSIYASYSVAYKSGTFNVANILSNASYIPPERAAAYEIGAKLDLHRQGVQANLALFDTSIRNMQSGFVSLFSAGAVDFISVPRARSRGGEFDGRWLAISSSNPLVFNLNAAYVDAIYTDFPHGPGFQQGNGFYSGNLDLTGDRVVYTPRWSGTIGAAQGIHVPTGSFEIAADEYYNSGYFTDAYNTVRERPYAILNTRIGYRHDPWNLSALVFCQNALDRRYHAVNTQTDFGTIRALAPPREVGFRVTWNFGGPPGHLSE